MSRHITEDDLKSLFAEGMHTAFRKAGDCEEAGDIWVLISKMPNREWKAIVEFLIWGLEVSGVEFCYKHENGERYPIRYKSEEIHGEG